MALDEILPLVAAIDPGIGPEHIAPLAGGFSSQAFKVSADPPFVLLVAKDGGAEHVNYGHAYVVLELLHQRGWSHAPKPLWLSPDRQAVAMSFSPGVPAHHFDFTGVNKEDLALAIMDSLLDIIAIKEEEYDLVAQKFQVQRPPIMETPAEAIRRYGPDWLSFLHDACPDRDVLAWLEPRIQRFIESNSRHNTASPLFIHADLSNGNILLDPTQEGAFTLIDWGAARFYAGGVEFLIAYITNLTDFMIPLTKALVTHTARRLGLSETDLSAQVEDCRRSCGISDIYWAALMAAKIHSGQTGGDASEFRRIALERISRYERVCE